MTNRAMSKSTIPLDQQGQMMSALKALEALIAAINQSLDLDTIINDALDQIMELFGCRSTHIRMIDYTTNERVVTAHRGYNADDLAHITKRRKSGEGFSSVSNAAAGVMVVEDLDTDPRYGNRDGFARRIGSRSFIYFPILAKGKLLGDIVIHYDTPRIYPPEEVQLFTAIGHLIGAAVENARSYREMLEEIKVRKGTEEALRESEKAARQLAKENELIAEIGHIISSTLIIEDVYELFARKVRESIPFDQIVINTVNMQDYTRTAKYVNADLNVGNYLGKVFPLAGTRTEHIVLTRSSMLINSKNREDMLKKFPGMLLQFGAQSMVMVPLISKDEVIGVLFVNSAKGDTYSENELRLIEKVGTQIAGAIANAELFLERKQAEKQLQDTFESLRKAVGTTIQVMVAAVESRDPYTAGHQIRSANLARAIATEMGLPPEKIEGIRMAGSIHDIGKLSIPAEILSKPTKLSDIEFSLIREHARRGYEMLKDVESPWPLAEIVRQHHERVDGSGYPRNLKGDEILIEARILAVADVVEAMASHRPYRPGLGIDAALNDIEQNSRIFYDKAVVDACLSLFREKGFKLEGT